nr:AI-2E family transporter [Hongsoonwoonella zoysiae]
MHRQRIASRLISPRRGPVGNIEAILQTASRASLVFLGAVGLFIVLRNAQFLLAPIFVAIILGLMFSPVATLMETRRIPPSISALAVVLLLLVIIATCVTLFALPLSVWIDRLPLIWRKLQFQITGWEPFFDSLSNLRDQLRDIAGQSSSMKVTVEEDSTVAQIAYIAPTIVAQVLLFLASLYFFIATRDRIRLSVLSLCFSRAAKLRAAHFFRDTERDVSAYLLSITFINAALGFAVGVVMFALGVPSPMLWGLLAFTLNYVIYVGPALMVVILLLVGIATFNTFPALLVPAGAYLGLNALESQFVTPHVLGRTLTLNPFFVFLALAFWLWLWGPVGGFIAVPSMLIIYAALRNALPMSQNQLFSRNNSPASGISRM